MTSKHDSITAGRVRRAMKIGEMTSQIGSSYIWNQLRRPFQNRSQRERDLLETHIRNAGRIVEGSQQLRGAFMKLIQLLSMRRDLLPADAIDILRTTQSDLPPMSYAMIAEQIRRELGRRPEALFASFEHTAFAAASLGQVHRATLKDGTVAAVKIQYPGVDETVEQDLRNLKLLLATVDAIGRDVMRRNIDTAAIYGELEQRLREELDYTIEAVNQRDFARMFKRDNTVTIPHPFAALSSRRVLTMTFVEGYPLAEFMNPSVDANMREWIARKIHDLAWRQILEFGVLQTDFHPGNYVVSHHPRLGVLDFGSIRRFPDSVRRGNLAVARALVARDDHALGESMRALGYIEPNDDARPIVEIMHELFEPMISDREWDPTEYDAIGKAARVGETAIAAGIYQSPAHSVFLIRALIGLEGLTRGLAVKMSYRRVFAEIVESIES